MGILEWIKNNKEIIAWGGGAIVAIYKFAALFYKRVWKPASVFIKKVDYEINNNGGKSIKDMMESANEMLIRISAMNDAMLAISDQNIYKCSSDGKCTFANDSLCDLYGATLEEMLGYGWINFIEPSEREATQKNWERAVEYDSSITAEYTIINGTTGEKIPCFYKAAIKRTKEGKIISILGIVKRKVN
jgi:PAS domain S-box-containing protein